MNDFSVRRKVITLATLATTALLIACGEDKRVKQLQLGITRDSAMTVIAQNLRGGGSDSFPNIYMRDRFLINGQNLEVLYFTSNNEKQGRDSVEWKKLTPLVFAENRLVAKGWDAWDSVSTANKIPLKPHK